MQQRRFIHEKEFYLKAFHTSVYSISTYVADYFNGSIIFLLVHLLRWHTNFATFKTQKQEYKIIQ